MTALAPEGFRGSAFQLQRIVSEAWGGNPGASAGPPGRSRARGQARKHLQEEKPQTPNFTPALRLREARELDAVSGLKHRIQFQGI